MKVLEKFPRRNCLGRLLTLLFCPEGCCQGLLIGCDFHVEGDFNYCAAVDGSSMCIRYGRCKLRYFYGFLAKLEDALFSKRKDFRYVYGKALDCFLLQHCSEPIQANCVRISYERANRRGGRAG